jgi:hypothetical protein
VDAVPLLLFRCITTVVLFSMFLSGGGLNSPDKSWSSFQFLIAKYRYYVQLI